MKVPPELLAGIDFEEVVRRELFSNNRYLPPNLVDYALRTRVGEVAERLRTRMKRDFEPAHQDSVLARKAGRGSRPLPFIALNDRLVYRALTSTLADVLPTPVSRDDYGEFIRSPLDVANCRFVLKTDVAAYYQYIDHERLIDEVVAQTGDDLAIVSVVELLQSGSRRRFGLPQMSEPSDLLADTYIDPVRRELVRSGFRVFRYADDFRVACENYNEALEALEITERSSFDLGLVLNEGKTTTPRLETYSDSLAEVERAEHELFRHMAGRKATVESFFLDFIPYDGTAPSIIRWLPATGADELETIQDRAEIESPSMEQVEAARHLLTAWSDPDNSGFDHWTDSVWSVLVRKSLLVLELTQDDHAVQLATSLLVQEPHLMPELSAYLVAVGADNPELIQSALDEICERDVVSVWQALWVAHTAGVINPADSKRHPHVAWLKRMVDSRHASLSAQAALSLAQRRRLSEAMAAAAYERAPEAHRSTVALAMAAAQTSRRLSFAPEDQLESWLEHWASQQPWGRPKQARSRPRRSR